MSKGSDRNGPFMGAIESLTSIIRKSKRQVRTVLRLCRSLVEGRSCFDSGSLLFRTLGFRLLLKTHCTFITLLSTKRIKLLLVFLGNYFRLFPVLDGFDVNNAIDITVCGYLSYRFSLNSLTIFI